MTTILRRAELTGISPEMKFEIVKEVFREISSRQTDQFDPAIAYAELLRILKDVYKQYEKEAK